MKAIILAGGLGTRLQSVVPDLPKPMAQIRNTPFLAILLENLINSGFTAVTLAVGHRFEAIRDYFGESFNALPLTYSIETEPLGTGGAIALALQHMDESPCFIVNGDTFLELDYKAMLENHLLAHSNLTVAVHKVANAERYGSLVIEESRIKGFIEKGCAGPGIINGGVYLLSKEIMTRYRFPARFSFETDLLTTHLNDINPLAFETEGTFIDIGVPEDYLRAQSLLSSIQ